MFYSKARHYLFSVVLFNLVLCLRLISPQTKTWNFAHVLDFVFAKKWEKKMSETMNGYIIKSISQRCAQINSFDLTKLTSDEI